MLYRFYCLVITAILFLSAPAQKKYSLIVAADGSGNCKTVQEALDKVPPDNKIPFIIFIRKGIYKERLILDTRRNNVEIIGEDKDKTILTYNNHAGSKLPNGDTVNTWSSASFFVYADNFTAENITIENDAGFTAGQAVALFVCGTHEAFYDCNFIGFQDVLFCSGYGTKQYFENCYIEGTTDFIFGPATAVFNKCKIHSKKNSHVTAASTPREIPYGFVFFDCVLTADSGINKVSLGRPWQPNASVIYIHCYLGSHIIPEGWHNWKNPDNEKTARYAEYDNYGPGANTSLRVSWSKQLTTQEYQDKYGSIEKILGNWNPVRLNK